MRTLLRRLAAQALDLSVIAGWALVAGLVAWVLSTAGIRLDDPYLADAVAFITLVAPSAITFGLFESSRWQATPGKRRLGLVVVDAGGSRISRSRALARSAVKFLPWQMGHTAVFHLAAGSAAVGWILLSMGAQLIVAVSVVTMAVRPDHRAIHDLVARTHVVDREERDGRVPSRRPDADQP